MSEREITFSQDEREQIGLQALRVASLGEECIDDLVRSRLRLVKLAIDRLNPFDLLHEKDVINEVIKQARTIMQFTGTDRLSIVDKEIQAAGLGSIFDPDSEIGKKVSVILYK